MLFVGTQEEASNSERWKKLIDEVRLVFLWLLNLFHRKYVRGKWREVKETNSHKSLNLQDHIIAYMKMKKDIYLEERKPP